MHATASCPAALSFIFKPCPHENPVKAGSIGVGCTIDRLVTVTIQPSDRFTVHFNNTPLSFPTVEYVIQALTNVPVTVAITSPLPLGYGFGISGASALATAAALNTLLGLQKPHHELQEIAHCAEIIHKTGLGTVATQITGGFLVKTTPGLPVTATSLPFVGEKLYVTIIDKMETPEILSDATLLHSVNQAADQALAYLHSLPTPSLAEVIDCAHHFIQKSHLPVSTQTHHVITAIRREGGSATMAILGQMVISTTPPVESGYVVQEVRIS